MQISAKKTTLLVALMALVAAGAFAALQRPEGQPRLAADQVEDADAVKVLITQAFETAPGIFNLPVSSTRLAKAKLDGYSVCTQFAEATAEQYIEVAQMLDKALRHVAEFQRAVNGVMDSKAGMSDCDFRVITSIAKVTTGG